VVVDYKTEGRIAVITLNRPEARNAVNGAVAAGVEEALNKFESDSKLWVAVLAANGPVFCAGADLKEIAAGNAAKLSTKKGGFAGLIERERTKPLIAAVQGSALAGGTEVVLACDIIIAAEHASFGLPEVKRSLAAAAGGLFRLPRAIGMAAALEVIMTGDPLSSERAYQLGMINQRVPAEDVMKAALEMAARICANAPLAVQASRAVAIKAFVDSDEALFAESDKAFASLATTEDFQEGPRAFIEKRAPVWKGR